VLFRTAQNDFGVRRDLQCGFAGLPGLWRAHRLGVAPLPGFFVEPMMKVDPESAMQLEHRKRSIRDIHLWSSRNRRPKQQVYSEEQYWQARGNDASMVKCPMVSPTALAHKSPFPDNFIRRVLPGRLSSARQPAIQNCLLMRRQIFGERHADSQTGLTYITIAADSNTSLWLCSRTWTCVPRGKGWSMSI